MPSLGLGPQVSGQEERSPEPQDHGRQWPGSWPPGPPLRLPWPHVSQGGSAAPPGRQEWMGACEGRWRVSSPRGVTGGAGAGERAAGSLLRLVLEGRPARRPRGTEGGEPWQPQVPILTCPRPRPQSPSGLGWRSPRLHPTSPNVCGANTNGPRGGGGGLRFPRWGLALGPSPPDWTRRLRPPLPFLPPAPLSSPPPFPSTSISSSPGYLCQLRQAGSGFRWPRCQWCHRPVRASHLPYWDLAAGSGVSVLVGSVPRLGRSRRSAHSGGGGSAPAPQFKARRGVSRLFPLSFLKSPAGPPGGQASTALVSLLASQRD